MSELSQAEREALKDAFNQTPIGRSGDLASYEEGWEAAKRFSLYTEQEVWTCMSCGAIVEGQSCLSCGSEAMPGHWVRAEGGEPVISPEEGAQIESSWA